MEKAIGIFDSGVGGLTVLKEIMRQLPLENTIYLGDTARVPYGTKSPEIITKYAFQNARFLLEKKIKLLVVACNTASAVSLDLLRERFNLPILGVVKPGAKVAVMKSNSKQIGVIGTEGTIASKAYEKCIKNFNKKVKIITRSCPMFVPLVEEGWTNNKIALLTAEEYLNFFKETDIDTLILGCTHYPLLKEIIGQVMDTRIVLVDSAEETAKEVKKVLIEKGLLRRDSNKVEHEIFVTDIPTRFIKLGKKFLDHELTNVNQIGVFS